jgi:hypothetical protein
LIEIVLIGEIASYMPAKEPGTIPLKVMVNIGKELLGI